MDSLLKAFPQWFLVLVILLAGIAFFYISMPPHTVCDSQVEILKSSQTPFIFLDPKKTYKTTSDYEKSRDVCKKGNSHGACREYFDGLRKLVENIKSIPQECYPKISDISQIKKSIWEALDIFTRLAWGEKPPEGAYEKMGWFDSYHMHIYCGLKTLGSDFYGEEKWTEFASSILDDLPQAKELNRNEAWARSILSTNCNQYR